MNLEEKINAFFSNREKQNIIAQPGKGKSKSLIYAFFEPLKSKGKITEEEFIKIINSDKTTLEEKIIDSLGKSKADEINKELKQLYIKD